MKRILKTISLETGPWIDLHISPTELRPCYTLVNGQTFGWKQLKDYDIWVGVIDEYPLAIKQTPSTVLYTCLVDPIFKNDDLHSILYSYFQLDVCLSDLYQLWSKKCPRLKVVAESIPGVRVLRQDPWECLASFIFSSNNNIKRITGGLEELRASYGNYICSLHISDESLEVYHRQINDICETDFHIYTFPSPDDIFSKSSEQQLRDLGMGYRARFLYESSKLVREQGGVTWLNDLRHRSYSEIQSSLLTLPGIGRKVADCVALFSLNQIDVIPVDTHVWAITNRDYTSYSSIELNSRKSLTDKIYQEIQRIFKQIFEEYVGWAHSLLFAGELNQFRSLLPLTTQQEMKEYDRKEREKKKTKRKPKQSNSNEEIPDESSILTQEKTLKRRKKSSS